ACERSSISWSNRPSGPFLPPRSGGRCRTTYAIEYRCNSDRLRRRRWWAEGGKGSPTPWAKKRSLVHSPASLLPHTQRPMVLREVRRIRNAVVVAGPVIEFHVKRLRGALGRCAPKIVARQMKQLRRETQVVPAPARNALIVVVREDIECYQLVLARQPPL